MMRDPDHRVQGSRTRRNLLVLQVPNKTMRIVDYLMLFKHIAADAWRDFTSTARAQEVAIEKRIRAAGDRRQRIIDLFVDRQLTPDVYAEQLGRADTEIGTDQQALAALCYDAIDADAAIDYALSLAAAPGQRWQSGSLPAKQRLQQVFFPKRLQFEDGEFRTSELGFLFKHLRADREPDSRLVAHTGFEPFELSIANSRRLSASALRCRLGCAQIVPGQSDPKRLGGTFRPRIGRGT